MRPTKTIEQCITKDFSVDKIKTSEYQESGDFAVIDQGKDLIAGYYSGNKQIYNGELPTIIYGDHTNIVKYIDFPFICGADGVKVLTPKNDIYAKYFYYVLNCVKPETQGYRRHYPLLKNIEIPLPPLETQKAIVAKLDQIFAELDQTKSEIQKNLDNTDELWKSAYDRILSIKGDEKSLEDLCEIVDYRGKTPKKTDKGILLVTAKNIRKGYIDYEKSKEYISEDDYDEVMHRGLPKIGDILFTTEAPCGNVAIIDNENIALAQRVVKYRPKNKEYLNNKYLLYVLLGNEFQKKLEMHSTGGTVKGIKGKILHKLTIPVPPLSEQEKIVEHLDQVSKEVKELKSQYQSQLDNLEELKKSVLDKAFRGELGE